MKPIFKNFFQLPTLVAGLALIPAGPVTAQTFTTLYSFTNGTDGAFPDAGLILSGSTLYGTTVTSDDYVGNGTLFAVSADSTNFRTLHIFTSGTPQAGLILSGSTLYGTAAGIFSLSTNGTDFLASSIGGYGLNSLILSGSTLYGTATVGSSGENGTVFSVTTNGANFINLYNFAGLSDGANPQAGLILSGSTLYGTTSQGGSEGNGSVFSVTTNGTNFTILHPFSGYSGGSSPNALILSGSTLYGMAYGGGSAGYGTVFAVSTNGTNFTNLYNFANGGDGSYPFAGLILSGNTLYGTASHGGSAGFGTVFSVNTNGSNFTTLYSFTNGIDGAFPYDVLILSGNTLYGTASQGGSAGYGTVFSLSFAPQLAINLSGTNVVLTWPTNLDGFDYSGFNLETTASLSPPAWSTNLPAPVVVNGQFTVSNPISATQQFFQLSK